SCRRTVREGYELLVVGGLQTSACWLRDSTRSRVSCAQQTASGGRYQGLANRRRRIRGLLSGLRCWHRCHRPGSRRVPTVRVFMSPPRISAGWLVNHHNFFFATGSPAVERLVTLGVPVYDP